MKRLVFALLMAAAVAAGSSKTASAQQPYGGYGFLPFGFYQPYGARYGQTIRTPPYFATNPPVYYGSRHSRPYGMSPFASPPLVNAPATYEGRLRSKAADGEHVTPEPCSNPYVCGSPSAPKQLVKGEVRMNPFVVNTEDRIAKN